MRYKLFGGSGLRVSELCLGTMAFGEDWGWGAPRQEWGRIHRSPAAARSSSHQGEADVDIIR